MSLRMAVPLLGEQSLGEGGGAGGGKPVSSRVTEMRPKKLLQIPLGTFLTLKKSKTLFLKHRPPFACVYKWPAVGGGGWGGGTSQGL